MHQIDDTTIGVKWWGVVYLILTRGMLWLFYKTLIHLEHIGFFILYPLSARSIKNYGDVKAMLGHFYRLDTYRSAIKKLW